MSELVRIVTASAPDFSDPAVVDHIAEEAADVAIVLTRLAELVGMNDLLDSSNASAHPAVGNKFCVRLTAETNAIFAALLTDLANNKPNTTIQFRLMETVANLGRVCQSVGRDLDVAIDLKMITNHNRKWMRDGAGHGHHVRERVPVELQIVQGDSQLRSLSVEGNEIVVHFDRFAEHVRFNRALNQLEILVNLSQELVIIRASSPIDVGTISMAQGRINAPFRLRPTLEGQNTQGSRQQEMSETTLLSC